MALKRQCKFDSLVNAVPVIVKSSFLFSLIHFNAVHECHQQLHSTLYWQIEINKILGYIDLSCDCELLIILLP